ncbi:MAG: hypothetical protein MJH10_09245 [Epibacterium sp.]|nr:hypothetical protein [Epibacterium sp.]NQX73720.1 hypothetical protein [Epibacterium sp.]
MAVNTAALLRIADMVDAIPDRQWEMLQFRESKFDSACETIGCAIGHAVHQPWANEEGFRLNSRLRAVFPGAQYEGFQPASMCWLGLSELEWFLLFTPAGYLTEKISQNDVSKRIRGFVVAHEKERRKD